MHYAARGGHADVCEVHAREAGVGDAMSVDCNGDTPLHIAMEYAPLHRTYIRSCKRKQVYPSTALLSSNSLLRVD